MLKQKPNWNATLDELDKRVAKVVEKYGVPLHEGKIRFLDARHAVHDLFRAQVVSTAFTFNKNGISGDGTLHDYRSHLVSEGQRLGDIISKNMGNNNAQHTRNLMVGEIVNCMQDLLKENGLTSELKRSFHLT